MGGAQGSNNIATVEKTYKKSNGLILVVTKTETFLRFSLSLATFQPGGGVGELFDLKPNT